MATRTWSSASSTDMNLATNYSGSGALLTTDDLVFNNTSVINATASGNLSVASLTVGDNYSGVMNISGRTITTTGSQLYQNTASSPTINASTILNIGGNYTLGKSWVGANPAINLTGACTITVLSTIAALGNIICSNSATFSGSFNVAPRSFKFAAGFTYTFIAGQSYTFSAPNAGDFSGTAGNLVTWVSSSTGTTYNVALGISTLSASYMSITDAINTGGGSIVVSDGTSIRGNNVSNITWPASIYYQDYGRADDTGTGFLMSTAKKTHQAALNLLSNAGDVLICRRATTEIPSATFTYPAFAIGTPSSPIKIMGMPRGTLAFTGTWVNNLNAIYNLNITAKPEQHIGRWVKNNTNTFDYLITDIIEQVAYSSRQNGGFAVGDTIVGATSTASWVVLQDTDLGSNTGLLVLWKWSTTLGRLLYSSGENLQKAGQTRGVASSTGALCFCIDRPYPGSSAAGTAGTIEADEDYTWSQTLTASAQQVATGAAGGNGADLLSTWTGDAHDLPIINWNGGNFGDTISRAQYEVRYLSYRGSSSTTTANIYNNGSATFKILGCYITANQAGKVALGVINTTLERSIIDCTTTGVTAALSAGGRLIIRNSAFHHLQFDLRLNSVQQGLFTNVNLGVEGEASGSELYLQTYMGHIIFKDVAIGAASTLISGHDSTIYNDVMTHIFFENFNKVLNAHKLYIYDSGTITKNDCTGGDVVARSGGAPSVAEFLLNTGTYAAQTQAPSGVSSVGYCYNFIEIKVWLSSSQLSNINFRFYVQSTTDAMTSSNFWLECEYIDSYTAQGYHKTIIRSTNSVSARANSSDWTQYLETGSFTPAAAGWVVIRIFDNLYSTNKKYVDPMYNGALRTPQWSLGSALPNPENVDRFPLLYPIQG